MPYYPDYKDIRKVSDKTEEIVIIPQPEYSPRIFPMITLGIDMMRQKFFGRDDTRYYYGDRVKKEILRLSPLLDERKLNWSWNPYKTHLKIGNQPYHYLKASFDEVIDRLKDVPRERIPLVMESHTKNYLLHYKPIEKFLHYINDKYGHLVEFGTLSGFYRELQENPGMIVVKKTAENDHKTVNLTA